MLLSVVFWIYIFYEVVKFYNKSSRLKIFKINKQQSFTHHKIHGTFISKFFPRIELKKSKWFIALRNFRCFRNLECLSSVCIYTWQEILPLVIYCMHCWFVEFVKKEMLDIDQKWIFKGKVYVLLYWLPFFFSVLFFMYL